MCERREKTPLLWAGSNLRDAGLKCDCNFIIQSLINCTECSLGKDCVQKLLVSWGTSEGQVIKEAEAGSTHSASDCKQGSFGSLEGLAQILGYIHQPIVVRCPWAMNYSADSSSLAFTCPLSNIWVMVWFPQSISLRRLCWPELSGSCNSCILLLLLVSCKWSFCLRISIVSLVSETSPTIDLLSRWWQSLVSQCTPFTSTDSSKTVSYVDSLGSS